MRIDNPTFAPGGLNTALSSSFAVTSSYALNVETVTDWISAGTVSIGNTGPGGLPSFPTTTLKNRVNYRRVGPKVWEVQAVINWNNNAGANNGVGDYLFVLPNSLRFDTSIVTQTLDTANIGTDTRNLMANTIPGSIISFASDNTVSDTSGVVIPYTDQTYRLLVRTGGTVRAWGNGHYQLDFNTNRYANWSFIFQST
jgi:hypothetical protein